MSLLLEPYGALVDELGDTMRADEQSAFPIHGEMKIAALRDILDTHGQWVSEIDFAEERNRALFWYVSEEKLEPRIGQRFTEPGQELEQPLAVARDVYLCRRRSSRPAATRPWRPFAAPSGAPPHRAPGATGNRSIPTPTFRTT